LDDPGDARGFQPTRSGALSGDFNPRGLKSPESDFHFSTAIWMLRREL
jgi:hypothetical protein